MEKWILPDRREFSSFVNKTIWKKVSMDRDAIAFTTSSAFRCLVLDPLSPYRGLLLYHGLGTVRRVRPSLSPSLSWLPIRKSLAPASLRKNFEQEVIKCGGNEFTSDRTVDVERKERSTVRWYRWHCIRRLD
jgi:hypothetical protein